MGHKKKGMATDVPDIVNVIDVGNLHRHPGDGKCGKKRESRKQDIKRGLQR